MRSEAPDGPQAVTQPAPWQDAPAGDVRLVVCDMDGTLLTGAGAVPEQLWSLLETMRRSGITFVPASGRQYATLAGQFDGADDGVAYIAENGSLVVHEGRALTTTGVEGEVVRDVVDAVRSSTADVGLVVCGVDSAYVERTDRAFLTEAETYYAKLTVVEDLTTVSDTVLKLAVHDAVDAAVAAETTLGHLADSHRVVVSGRHWVDVMNPDVDKGRGVRHLQEVLGVSPAQTVVFGDYLNDLEMLDAATRSFAMANAHPEILARARYVAPTNDDHGVVTVLAHLLGT